ncbi:MAG: polysaccharide deacetylase family protein [Actinomycetota bacterium]|nr:polysaccharide deacetylase family protein [Actinomycetota bacterium]
MDQGSSRNEVRAARNRGRPSRGRIKFTRRFYILLGCVALGVIMLIVVIAAASSGGDIQFEQASQAAGLVTGDLHRLKVNELGAVMVLEYHRIGEEGRWSRTPENFLSDLETLYEDGYQCIRLSDLAANYINVEPGYTPVILTFDDSDPSQFTYIEQDGDLIIDPDCAMGIMENFASEHPDFNMTATFYVLPQLFGQEEYVEKKLNYLVEKGYSIGNHTMNHPSLADLDDQTVLDEITGNVELIQSYLPDYQELSIALPNGSEPQNPSLLVEGSLDGVEYHFIASLLVGANPAPAPCDPSFDPMRMPRVQALDPSLDSGGCGICSWLQYFMENPERRYYSDGAPEIVTIPKHMTDRIDMDKVGDKELRTY